MLVNGLTCLGVLSSPTPQALHGCTLCSARSVGSVNLNALASVDLLRVRADKSSQALCMTTVMGRDSRTEGEARAGKVGANLRNLTWNLVGKNTKWIVSLSAAAVLLYRRDAIAVSAIFGALSNAVLGKTLKRVLRQKRPDGAPLADPGMPSSHAMSLFFLSCYLCAAILSWTPTWLPVQRAAAMGSLLCFSTFSAAWRVTSGLHTMAQILVCAVLGGTNGVLWFHFTAGNMAALHAMDKIMAANNSIPAMLCGVLVAGALIVGSIERKIGAFLKK